MEVGSPAVKKRKISSKDGELKKYETAKRTSHIIFKKDVPRDRIKAGDLVIVQIGRAGMRQEYITPCEKFNCKSGFYCHDDFIGKKYGQKIYSRSKSDTSQYVIPLRPDPILHTISLRHRTQILYGLDISVIMLGLDLFPGKIVIEAGTGSGGMTTSLSQCIHPNGMVHTFEYHEERFEEAKKEFLNNDLANVIRSNHGDVCENGFVGIGDSSVDAVFLDLPQPSVCVREVYRVLKVGGRFSSFSPCIEQVMKTCEKLHEIKEFDEIETKEFVMFKYYKKRISMKSTKPNSKANMKFAVIGESDVTGHTAYLTFATKL